MVKTKARYNKLFFIVTIVDTTIELSDKINILEGDTTIGKNNININVIKPMCSYSCKDKGKTATSNNNIENLNTLKYYKFITIAIPELEVH